MRNKCLKDKKSDLLLGVETMVREIKQLKKMLYKCVNRKPLLVNVCLGC
jgi:hypothetical protein